MPGCERDVKTLYYDMTSVVLNTGIWGLILDLQECLYIVSHLVVHYAEQHTYAFCSSAVLLYADVQTKYTTWGR